MSRHSDQEGEHDSGVATGSEEVGSRLAFWWALVWFCFHCMVILFKVDVGQKIQKKIKKLILNSYFHFENIFK